MKYIIIFLMTFTIGFALELSNSHFSEIIKLGNSISKQYTLTNNSELIKEYFLSTTDPNVKIQPKGFKLKPFEKKKFTITAVPKKLGKTQYYLEIKEVIREKSKGNSVNVNKLFRIQQHYIGK